MKSYDSWLENISVFELRIATGCNGSCTYCAIKTATGSLKSKPLDRILSEFENGLSKGYKVFRLIAEDVGAYGQDNGTNIVDLLSGLFRNKQKFQLIFDDFSPKWLIMYFPDLFQIITKHSNRFGYVGLPIQSGSEKILSLMKRDYTAEDAKKCMLALKKACPELHIHTHVLIGFPGEDEEDFLGTIEYLRDVPFDRVAIYKYSDRPNTPASKSAEKVPKNEMRGRMLRIREIVKKSLESDYPRPQAVAFRPIHGFATTISKTFFRQSLKNLTRPKGPGFLDLNKSR